MRGLLLLHRTVLRDLTLRLVRMFLLLLECLLLDHLLLLLKLIPNMELCELVGLIRSVHIPQCLLDFLLECLIVAVRCS